MKLDERRVLTRYERNVVCRQVLVLEEPSVLEIDEPLILTVATGPEPRVMCVDADRRGGKVALIRRAWIVTGIDDRRCRWASINIGVLDDGPRLQLAKDSLNIAARSGRQGEEMCCCALASLRGGFLLAGMMSSSPGAARDYQGGGAVGTQLR